MRFVHELVTPRVLFHPGTAGVRRLVQAALEGLRPEVRLAGHATRRAEVP